MGITLVKILMSKKKFLRGGLRGGIILSFMVNRDFYIFTKDFDEELTKIKAWKNNKKKLFRCIFLKSNIFDLEIKILKEEKKQYPQNFFNFIIH